MGAPPKLPVQIGEVVAGKYAIERIIGSGGMGVIAAARHVQLEQRVALKFLHSHVLSSDQAVARFMREARATVRLKSDHVARVFDVDTLPTGEPYAVMELLEGLDLATYARQNGPLRIAEAVEFVVQACEGIVEAHALGIVHRDLKPQNLFVTRRINGSPRIKVLDFGISKQIGGADFSLTDSAVVLGSPLYMSPEQMKASRSVDVRSDVWSLGVILYDLLTGNVPFDGESITELCLKVVTATPREPREMRKDIPEPLAACVLRCLEKDANARFPSVAALAEALEPYSAGAERGTTDRSWRSLAETADAFRVIAPMSTPPVANTHNTWDKAADAPAGGKSARYRRVGVAAAVTLAAVIGTAAVLTLRREPSPTAPTAAITTSASPAPVAATAGAIAEGNSASTVSAASAGSAVPAASAPSAASAPLALVAEPKRNSVAEAIAARPSRSKPTPALKPHDTASPPAGGAPVVPQSAPDAGASFKTTANNAPILP